jgi:hypothetical protein
MAESKTYSVICPDPNCANEFKIELSAAELADGAELIACPECNESWEWNYDEAAGTLELLPDEGADDEEEDEEEEIDEDDEDDEDDEEV